ncbi:MaoC family dehydratase N-terminal domain-containing protein, partial [Acinetobacter baumannii]
MIDRKWIGYELPPSVLPIARPRLLFLAKATGQTHPIYVDVDAARAAGYPDLPAPPT